MKNGKFRKIEMTIARASGFGSYIIEARYRGTFIVTFTADSTVYDNFDSDNKSDKNEALRHAYYKACAEYEYQKNRK